MANYSPQPLPYANNATIITGLTKCDQVVNFTQALQDLYNLYSNNVSNPASNDFSNVSIIHFNCTSSSGKYFEQIITFTKLISIHVQIIFASVYYDYIYANQYSFDGFFLERERWFNLSSITLNNSAQFEACSSADVAHDSLCGQNSSSICTNMFSNPWLFNCSKNSTSTITPAPSTNNNQLLSTADTALLSPWQIGLVCGFSVFFLLIILLLVGYFLRRHLRSKRVTFSCENLLTDMKSMQNRGIPQVQAFERVTTIVQHPQGHATSISQIPYGNSASIINENHITRKVPDPYSRSTFIDHAKVHDPAIPSTSPPKSTKPIFTSNNHVNTSTSTVYRTITISRPVSGMSPSQLRSIINGLEEDTLDESDRISLDRSNSTNSKKPSTPISRQFANVSFVDESLHDEDAWMSILAVANAELDVLNRLENEQNQTLTIM